MRLLNLLLALILAQGPTIPIGSTGSNPLGNAVSVVEYICVNNGGVGGCQANGSTSATANFASNTTAGELIFALSLSGATGTAYGSITDSGSQVGWTQDATLRRTGMGAHFASTAWYICGSAAGISSVTWTYGTSDIQSNSKLIVAHVKGIATTSCKDTSVNYASSATGTPYTSSSITPAAGKNEWIVGAVVTTFSTSTTLSATAPWALQSDASTTTNHIALFDQVIGSTSGSYAAAGTGTSATSIYWIATIAFTH